MCARVGTKTFPFHKNGTKTFPFHKNVDSLILSLRSTPMHFPSSIYFDYYVANQDATALVVAGKIREAAQIYLEIICQARQRLQSVENYRPDSVKRVFCQVPLAGNFILNSVPDCCFLPLSLQTACGDQSNNDLVPPNGFALCDCLFLFELHNENNLNCCDYDILIGIFVATVFNLAMTNLWQYLLVCNDPTPTCQQLHQSLKCALNLFGVVQGTLQNPEIMFRTVEDQGSQFLAMVVLNNIGYINSIYCNFDAVEESLRLLRKGLAHLYLLERTKVMERGEVGWTESRLLIQDLSNIYKTIVVNAQCLCHQYLLGAPMA
jgi:hypothetical protein